MKVGIVLGTRPEVIKNYPVVNGLRAQGIDFAVLHTNQHAGHAMHDAIFSEMGYQPDFAFPGEYSIGGAIDWVKSLIEQLELDLILVNGDTAAALVGTVAALYSDVRLAHVEAGLRAYDKLMYEERNRIICDSAAHFLFTNTSTQKAYLEQNRELRGQIFNSGNTSVDLIRDFESGLARPLSGRYSYVTLHRKEFTDRKDTMLQVFSTLSWLSKNILSKIVFPLHPRTRDAMMQHGITESVLTGIDVIDPVPPLASLAFEKFAEVILTDSGCIQEEAYILGVPCVTIRENTERMETVESGANIVSGFERSNIIEAVTRQLARTYCRFPPIYGEYGVGIRIASVLANA